MNIAKQTILNKLTTLLPEGVPVSGKWLNENIGCSKQLIQNYFKNNWLDKLCKGIYIRQPNKISWESIVLSLQKYSNVECFISGITALKLQGFVHYLNLSEENEINLSMFEKNPPYWIKQLPFNFVLNKKRIFADSAQLEDYEFQNFYSPIKISSAEQAILELFAEVNDESSFSSAFEIFETMTSLRPIVMKKLLSSCKNIKAKRLYFFMSTIAGHQWCNKINKDDYNLGKGKRSIVKGGKFNKEFLITIPKEF